MVAGSGFQDAYQAFRDQIVMSATTKSSNYRSSFLNNVDEETLSSLKSEYGDNLSGLDVNHRLPPGILKGNQDALQEVLDQLGVSSVNDPRLLELMASNVNRIGSSLAN